MDKLLASFLKDVGITAEQFMNACKEGSGSPQFRGMHRVGSFNKNSWKNPAGITSKELKKQVMNVCKEGRSVERVASTLNQDLYSSWNFLGNSWHINIFLSGP